MHPEVESMLYVVVYLTVKLLFCKNASNKTRAGCDDAILLYFQGMLLI
jgi:hypothetical protein